MQKKFSRVLSEIADRAGGIEFMVFCGVAKLIRGIRTEPHDLDILVDKKSLPLLDRRLEEYRVEPPHLSDNEFFSGTLARYRIGGIDVDISGGILAKGGSYDFLLEIDPELASRAGESGRPLVIPLEEQLIFDFVRRDKPEKVGLLLDHFRANPPDIDFLKKRLEKHNVPAEVRGRLLSAAGGP